MTSAMRDASAKHNILYVILLDELRQLYRIQMGINILTMIVLAVETGIDEQASCYARAGTFRAEY